MVCVARIATVCRWPNDAEKFRVNGLRALTQPVEDPSRFVTVELARYPVIVQLKAEITA